MHAYTSKLLRKLYSTNFYEVNTDAIYYNSLHDRSTVGIFRTSCIIMKVITKYLGVHTTKMTNSLRSQFNFNPLLACPLLFLMMAKIGLLLSV